MSSQKVIGIICVILGVGLIFWGYSVSSSIGGQLGSAVSGAVSTEELLAYVGGVVALVLGVRKLK